MDFSKIVSIWEQFILLAPWSKRYAIWLLKKIHPDFFDEGVQTHRWGLWAQIGVCMLNLSRILSHLKSVRLYTAREMQGNLL